MCERSKSHTHERNISLCKINQSKLAPMKNTLKWNGCKSPLLLSREYARSDTCVVHLSTYVDEVIKRTKQHHLRNKRAQTMWQSASLMLYYTGIELDSQVMATLAFLAIPWLSTTVHSATGLTCYPRAWECEQICFSFQAENMAKVGLRYEQNITGIWNLNNETTLEKTYTSLLWGRCVVYVVTFIYSGLSSVSSPQWHSDAWENMEVTWRDPSSHDRLLLVPAKSQCLHWAAVWKQFYHR